MILWNIPGFSIHSLGSHGPKSVSKTLEQIIRKHLFDFHIPLGLFGMLLTRLPQNFHDSTEQFGQFFAANGRSDRDMLHGNLLGRLALKLLDKGGKVEALPQITEKGVAFLQAVEKGGPLGFALKAQMVNDLPLELDRNLICISPP